MPELPSEELRAEDATRIPGLGDLPAPSSLLSSRWSRDNLVTSHPARLYDGPIRERIDADTLEYLVQDLVTKRGPLRVGAARMGVFTWDIACEDAGGPFVLQIPLTLDEPGRRGRAKRDVPRLNVENARHFSAQGLTRFVVPPEGHSLLTGGVPVAIFAALPQHRPVSFGAGALHVMLPDGSLVELGSVATADLLAEMIAALVYHYEPETDGGTAVTDVFVNDGDFAVKRRQDGTFDVRLTAVRRREPGIGPSLLLLYLVQLMAYEDFAIGGALTGLPLLVSNPAVTFTGAVRGLRYRFADLGRAEQDGERQARQWIADFSRSPEGRAYRPWADAFLEGRLPLAFGEDPRERWWRLFPEQQKQSLLELRGRLDPRSPAADSGKILASFLERLSREIGRAPSDDPGTFRLNDLGQDGMVALLAEARVPADDAEAVARELFAEWPHKSLDQVLARVPAARGLRRLKSRITLGRITPPSEQGTLKALGPPPPSGPARAIANREIFGRLAVPPTRAAAAVSTFLTFEAYMDAALHDPEWGYYARRVVIGSEGHFQTHPEELSPHYGRWIAEWAYKAWRDILARGELSEHDAYPLIEFGAGNGRLALDILDAIVEGCDDEARPDRESRRTFATRVAYRVYEMSESLRAKQRALLGERAVVAPGDARNPGATLKRDFPEGLRGFVVTNEVPDAFGVQKVVITHKGDAFAALVVPRIEQSLVDTLERELAERVTRVDSELRASFEFSHHPADRYLDAPTFAELMRALSGLPPPERDARLAALWLEEAYVAASAIPELAAHLALNARDYATALAVEPSGVVLYANVHADGFMRGLASALRAGFIVTIDYGDSTSKLVHGARRGDFQFRVYGEWRDYVPRVNDPYFCPGSQDLTADVNFTALARAGLAEGLSLVHFGPERDVIGDALPEVLRSASGQDPFAKLLGNPVFKVLVLGTRPSDAFTSALATPEPLASREQDVPKVHREKIPAIRERLARL